MTEQRLCCFPVKPAVRLAFRGLFHRAQHDQRYPWLTALNQAHANDFTTLDGLELHYGQLFVEELTKD